jgi:antitoxin HigA-1
VIRTIRHKGLKRFYQDDDPRGVMTEHAAKLRDILATRWTSTTSITIEGGWTMPMKNPPHPGGFVLRQCIEPLGLTITEAAAALGVTRTTLSELVNGKRGISPEMAVRLSKVFGGSAATWLTQQAHYDLAQVQADRIKLKRLEFA